MIDSDASAQAAADALDVYQAWHERARSRDVPSLLALYAPDAVLESPLIPRVLDDCDGGVLRGHAEIGRFLQEGTDRRPNELVRWHRTGEYLWNGRTLVWEYPRETPDGDQIDILELMEVKDRLIHAHRIYWGWIGTELLIANAVASRKRPAEKAGRAALSRA